MLPDPCSVSCLPDKIVVIKLREVASTPAPRQDLAESVPIDVTGKVTNEKGEPLPGVTVTVKGTDKITSTDAAGFSPLPVLTAKQSCCSRV